MILSSLSALTGPLLAAAAVVVVAGVAKLRRPAPTGLALARLGLPGTDRAVRALGAAEVAVAGLAAVLGGLVAVPLAVLYLGFAAVSAAQLRQAAATGEAADCGCFGDHSAPIGRTHVVINLALAALVLAGVLTDVDGLVTGVADAPVALAAVAALALVAEAGIRALLTDLPVLRAWRDAGAEV